MNGTRPQGWVFIARSSKRVHQFLFYSAISIIILLLAKYTIAPSAGESYPSKSSGSSEGSISSWSPSGHLWKHGKGQSLLKGSNHKNVVDTKKYTSAGSDPAMAEADESRSALPDAHLLLPINEGATRREGDRFCKTAISAIMNGYNTGVYNWGGQTDDVGRTHRQKVSGNSTLDLNKL